MLLCSYQRREVRCFSFNDLNQRAKRVPVLLIAVMSVLRGKIDRAGETRAKPRRFTPVRDGGHEAEVLSGAMESGSRRGMGGPTSLCFASLFRKSGLKFHGLGLLWLLTRNKRASGK